MHLVTIQDAILAFFEGSFEDKSISEEIIIV